MLLRILHNIQVLFFTLILILFSNTASPQDQEIGPAVPEDYETEHIHENVNGNQFENHNKYSPSVKENKFDREEWKKATKDIDYTPKNKKKEKKEKKEPEYDDSTRSTTTLPDPGPIGQIIFYALAIAAILIILYYIFGRDLFMSNKKLPKKKTVTIENLEEEIHESDLDIFLREALKSNNYKLAIRIYYLMIIKELSVKNWIEWKKNKTNREYLFEMNQRKEYQVFFDITRNFERIWYGDLEIKETDYSNMSPAFQNFIDNIKKGN
ncbi:MAG: hypothetical protein K2X86_03155 [Cytophagaceae bacterium]|nr:hypothetical protein [Cytophagaceae bacterium]